MDKDSVVDKDSIVDSVVTKELIWTIGDFLVTIGDTLIIIYLFPAAGPAAVVFYFGYMIYSLAKKNYNESKMNDYKDLVNKHKELVEKYKNMVSKNETINVDKEKVISIEDKDKLSELIEEIRGLKESIGIGDINTIEVMKKMERIEELIEFIEKFI